MKICTVFLLCLLCMGQAAAAPFSAEREEVARDSAGASASMGPPSPSPTATMGGSIGTPTPVPSSGADSAGTNDGLKNSTAFLGVAGFIMAFIFVGAIATYYDYDEDGDGAHSVTTSLSPSQQGCFGRCYDGLVSLIMEKEVFGGWHRFLFRCVYGFFGTVENVCLLTFGCLIISVVLVIVGLGDRNGELLGTALLLFFLFSGMVSERELLRTLGFADKLLEIMLFYCLMMFLCFVFVVPALYATSATEGGTAVFLSLMLGLFMSIKAGYSIADVRYGDRQGGGGSSYQSGDGL